MTAPKPGDRVRVTYEGTWTGDYARVLPGIGPSTVLVNGTGYDFPDVAAVEVLASPVYVNSDTTEYQRGDVVTAVSADDDRVWSFAPDDFGATPWRLVGETYVDQSRESRKNLPALLRLLVRDGKPVQS